MTYKKLVADCDLKLMEKVVKATQKERRTLANFIRVSCEERANKILNEEEEDGKKSFHND